MCGRVIIVAAHAPTEEAAPPEKDLFWDALAAATFAEAKWLGEAFLVLCIDANAKIGLEHPEVSGQWCG